MWSSSVLVSLTVLASTASANPRPLAHTLTTDTLAPGDVDLVTTTDLVPLRRLASMREVTFLASAFASELEIGLVDRLELGLTATLVPSLDDRFESAGLFAGVGNGLRQRIRYTFNEDPDSWPIVGNVGALLEISETESDVMLDGRFLFERRFDRLSAVFNISVAYQIYFDDRRAWVITPSGGLTYEITPKFHVGAEAWQRAEYPDQVFVSPRPFSFRPQAYAGPSLMLWLGKVWWTAAAYARITDIDHDLEPGEPYGRFWFRSVIGFDL
ncbi:MAG: hypothetical protein HOV81_16365 [Kofleriaceae bacterium]|nr:hypothetical protein [Kofleriaceae bacterium]